jgi:hypothetical protein
MYGYANPDQILPDRSIMFADNHGAGYNGIDGYSPSTHPQYLSPPQPYLTSPLQNSIESSNHETMIDPPDRHDEPRTDASTAGEGQHARPTQRPSQNRAAFGKWRSKMMNGFAAADVPLPQGITAKEICQLFPNHVDDYVILALMRNGNGAKAIDALIPAPPGKRKAGQSHSKIQLRVSTIREAFPNETFPIASTKRGRARSQVLKDEATKSEDEDADGVTDDEFPGSIYPIARGSSRKKSHTEAEPEHQHFGVISNNTPCFDPGISRGHGIPFQTGKQPLGLEVQDPSAFNSDNEADFSPCLRPDVPTILSTGLESATHFAVDASRVTSHPGQNVLLDLQIKSEYQKHKRLVFDFFYHDMLLSRAEVEQTVISHCADMYDSICHELQAESGLLLRKATLPDGSSENSISYLRRTIKQAFERLPDLRASINLNCPQDQISIRLEKAVHQELLRRLEGCTRYLEGKLKTLKQIRRHQNLHARGIGNTEVIPIQQDWTPTSQPAEGPNAGANKRIKMDTTSQAPQSLTESRPSASQASMNPSQIVSEQGTTEQAMMDESESSEENSRDQFRDYMREAGQFVRSEARAADLPPIAGKQPSAADA